MQFSLLFYCAHIINDEDEKAACLLQESSNRIQLQFKSRLACFWVYEVKALSTSIFDEYIISDTFSDPNRFIMIPFDTSAINSHAQHSLCRLSGGEDTIELPRNFKPDQRYVQILFWNLRKGQRLYYVAHQLYTPQTQTRYLWSRQSCLGTFW